jgi:ABC-type multidrug transport system fused ATPase/permease subunit
VSDAAVVRYRPGTAGERAANAVARDARRARKRLAGLGSEPWGVVPTICLVDPFPDPADPTATVSNGTVVDASRNEIWMAVTAESPPEPLERPMALLFGASLPSGDSVGPLLEGYGLMVAESPEVDDQLRELDLPPLGRAEGELGAAMALSFVRYLVERGGREAFLRMLASAQAGRLDAAAQQEYGAGMAALEEGWRQKLAAGAPDMKTGQFLRLTVRYLRPHKRREIEMFVYMIFGLAFTVVYPFAFKNLLDHAIPSGEFSQVLSILVLLLVAFVITSLAQLRGAYLSAVVSGSVVRQLRQEMFSKMQHLSQGWYNRHQQGDVLSRVFSDVSMLEQGLSQTLRNGLVQILTLIVSATVLLILDVWLALIVLAGAPVIAVIYKAMAKGAQKRSIAVQEETGSVLNVASENYGAQSVVKAFGLQLREIGRFRQSSDRLFDRQVKLQLFGGLFSLSVQMVVTGLQVFILGLGAWLILHGHLTIGGLVAFMSLMGQTLAPVTVLTGIGQQIQASTGALVRINEVLDADPEVDEAPDATTLAPLAKTIELRDVGFSYTAERVTLDHIDVKITAGQRVAFVGPTGAGKSSVLQLLMRFYDPDQGAVLFDGVDLRQATVESLRAQLGVVFQETFLFNATIRENIALGNPGASDAEIEAAARAAELHDFVMGLPRGYETLVGERGGRLSGGQRQRLSIARALLRDPRVLLLDEATSALDPRTERMISDTLERVGAGRTTIAVTHRLTSITTYDQICVIVAGQLVEHGTHEQLLATGGVYSQLWAEQTSGVAPTEVPFDPTASLARTPLFAELDPTALAGVAGRLKAVDLPVGANLEEGGRLVIVRTGSASVLAPDFTGELAPVTDLGPGDVFGLAAVLGDPKGYVLHANDAVSLLALDDEAIRALAGLHPTVAAALEARGAREAGPVGGTRLSRLTIAPGSRLSLVAPAAGGSAAAVGPPSAEDVRRMTGSLPAVGQ